MKHLNKERKNTPYGIDIPFHRELYFKLDKERI
jgi:hypothetical protein